jgi:hypothetical protein
MEDIKQFYIELNNEMNKLNSSVEEFIFNQDNYNYMCFNSKHSNLILISDKPSDNELKTPILHPYDYIKFRF